jgi:hypothetical protein
MTKPGITRWKITPSYQPHSASATKLPAAIGDRAPSTSIWMSPSLVEMVTRRFWSVPSGAGWLVGQPAG